MSLGSGIIKQYTLFQSIKLKRDITKLFEVGQVYRGSFFIMKYRFVNQCTPPFARILWCISKKIGPAHVRNNIKRMSKDIFFQLLKSSKGMLTNNLLYLAFIPSHRFLSLSFQDKLKNVEQALVAISFFREK